MQWYVTRCHGCTCDGCNQNCLHAGSLLKLTINGNQLRALAPECGQLTNLKELHLQGNQLAELATQLYHLAVGSPTYWHGAIRMGIRIQGPCLLLFRGLACYCDMLHAAIHRLLRCSLYCSRQSWKVKFAVAIGENMEAFKCCLCFLCWQIQSARGVASSVSNPCCCTELQLSHLCLGACWTLSAVPALHKTHLTCSSTVPTAVMHI